MFSSCHLVFVGISLMLILAFLMYCTEEACCGPSPCILEEEQAEEKKKKLMSDSSCTRNPP